LLVFWSVYCVTATDTYLDMRHWLCLVDDPNPAQSCGIISYRDPKSF
jgi:hypothetical protein